MIATAVDRSESGGSQASRRRASKGFSAAHGGASTGGSIGSMSTGYAANQSADLAKVC